MFVLGEVIGGFVLNIMKYKMIRAGEELKAKLIQAKYKLKYRGKYVPWLMQVEITNICNANCVYCRREFLGEPKHMDLDLFKKIVDATPFITQIHTQGFGEPLIYPNFVEAIKYASDRGKRVVFYTNASVLTEEKAIEILEAGVGQVRFSVDSYYKEGFEKMRPPLKWDTVLDNIKRFMQLRDDGGYKTTTVVRITVTEDNKYELEETVSFWKLIVDRVSWSPEIYIPTPDDLTPLYADGIGRECTDPNEHLIIDNVGGVSFCCQCMYGMHVIVNITDLPVIDEKSVIELYNGKRFNEIRESIRTGKNLPSRCKFCVPC